MTDDHPERCLIDSPKWVAHPRMKLLTWRPGTAAHLNPIANIDDKTIELWGSHEQVPDMGDGTTCGILWVMLVEWVCKSSIWARPRLQGDGTVHIWLWPRYEDRTFYNVAHALASVWCV